LIQEKLNIDKYLDGFQNLKLVDFIFENQITILILLDYIKAKDWPYKGKKLNNDPILNIPLIWAIFYSDNGKDVKIDFEIHPTKCFPNLYNNFNNNQTKNPSPIITVSNGTLAGCLRNFVTISNKKYRIKVPEYCSIFGLPDDCYDSFFEKRMIDVLLSKKNTNVWCYEKTDYIESIITPNININYMKGDFLPKKYYPYIDKPINFLKGLYKNKDLNQLETFSWYFNGNEFINERNLDLTQNDFKIEETSIRFIKIKLIFEFLRLLILLKNKQEFIKFKPNNYPQLNLVNRKSIEKDIQTIVRSLQYNGKLEVQQILKKYDTKLEKQSFNKSRFLVMDVEFLHPIFPTGDENRTFNFPCIFSSILWGGPRKGVEMNVNVLTLPCNFCIEENCQSFKKRRLKFDCLIFAYDFIDKQVSILEEYLVKYENFKIYTYGNSDIFQLEKGDNFFKDSFEARTYFRRNRKRTKRIVNIAYDLSKPSKSLNEIESDYLEKWLPEWTRKNKHTNVNRKFMTKWESRSWRTNYMSGLNTCVDDTISTFLFLLFEKYRI